MKKKLIKKTSMFLSVLLMTQALLTGCGSNNSSGTNVDENGKAVLEVDENGKVNGIMNAEGLPIVDNKGDYTFSIFVDNSTPLEGQFVWSMLEEQTNVQVDVKSYAYEIAQEKYGLALSSGDYTDVIGGWCLSSNDILTYGVDMGIFIPLEDYFEKFAPNIMELLEMPGVRETMTAPDGHIYAIPYVIDAPKVDFSPYINKKWLDTLGLEMPTNTEEFREVLRAFKTQDPNGNGKADEIPFSSDPNNRKLGYLCGWFGLPIESDGFTMIDGKLEFGANREEYKMMIEYMASLNAEGLLDPEFFTQDLATWKGKGNQDLYGASIAYGSGDFKPFQAGQKPDYEPLPVLSSPQCSEPKWLADSYGISTLKNQVVITDKAKNPEIIVRWWDNLYETDNSFQALNGPFDITCEKLGEKHYKVFDRSKLDPEVDEKYSWANIFCQSLPKNVLKQNITVEEVNPAYPEKEIVDELYEPYFVGNDGNGNYTVTPDYWIDPENAAKLSEYKVSITDYINQKTAQWISGQADVNAEWDEYCAQLDKLGLQEYIKIRQEALKQK